QPRPYLRVVRLQSPPQSHVPPGRKQKSKRAARPQQAQAKFLDDSNASIWRAVKTSATYRANDIARRTIQTRFRRSPEELRERETKARAPEVWQNERRR